MSLVVRLSCQQCTFEQLQNSLINLLRMLKTLGHYGQFIPLSDQYTIFTWLNASVFIALVTKINAVTIQM